MKQNEEVKVEYWDNGNKYSESHYKNGKLDGVFTRWFDTGVMDTKKKYTNGKPDYDFKFMEGDDMELRELNLSK